MYYTNILNGVSVSISIIPTTESDTWHEITKEQFNGWTRPCKAEITSDGVVFGDIVPWDEVPAMGTYSECNDEYIAPPTMEERVSSLEEQVAQSDETAIALYEAQLIQEEINKAQDETIAAQDETLIMLYEMIGG